MAAFDGKYFTFFVDDHWLRGEIQVKDFSRMELLIQELTQFLKEQKIIRIHKEFLKQCLALKDTTQKYLIAEGIPPVPGHNEYYELLIDIKDTPRPMDRMDGGVDFKELFIPNLVKPNRPVLRRIPASEGKKGLDIRGQVLEPEIRNIHSVLPSEDLYPSPSDPDIFLSAKGGLVKISGQKVVIEQQFHVRGDVDYSTGNIRFPGDVIIDGVVKSGFTVVAEGDILIKGGVEDAIVEAGKNIKIKEGFTGNGSGVMKAGGDVELVHCLNQRIECENLIFHKELINTTVIARNSVVSRRGKIIGGEIRAFYKVEVFQIGHEESTRAIISVGSRKDLMQRKTELETNIKDLYQQMEQIKEKLYELFKKKIRRALSEEEILMMEKLEKQKDSIPAEIQALERNLTEINQAFERIKNANITVFGTIYPGNSIVLFNLHLNPNETYNHVMIRYDMEKDELVVVKL